MRVNLENCTFMVQQQIMVIFIIKGQIWGRAHGADHCSVFCQLLDSSNSTKVSGSDSTDGARYQGIGYAGVIQKLVGKVFTCIGSKDTGIDAETYSITMGIYGVQKMEVKNESEFWNINRDDDRSHQHNAAL